MSVNATLRLAEALDALYAILMRLDVALSTRASEATIAIILAQLDVALSTRASEAAVAAILAQLQAYLPQSEYFVDDTAPNPDWNGLAIAANDETNPIDVEGYSNKTVYFLSTVAGTLTVEVEEPDGTYRDFDVVGITINILRAYHMPEQATNIKLRFDQIATVTAWLTRGVA